MRGPGRRASRRPDRAGEIANRRTSASGLPQNGMISSVTCWRQRSRPGQQSLHPPTTVKPTPAVAPLRGPSIHGAARASSRAPWHRGVAVKLHAVGRARAKVGVRSQRQRSTMLPLRGGPHPVRLRAAVQDLRPPTICPTTCDAWLVCTGKKHRGAVTESCSLGYFAPAICE